MSSTAKPETSAKPETQDFRTGGGDAVCFTAGHVGAPFAAGVIHAWLAADRKPPEIAAGISTGALSAAALQRAYRELEAAAEAGAEEVEASRWAWFRRYVENLSSGPFDVLWKAFPDPVDFLSDQPPVRDPSAPPLLAAKEAEARRAHFLLVQLGRWLGGLPVTLRNAARTAVAYVRTREGSGGLAPWRRLGYRLLQLRLLLSVLSHFLSTPAWVPEWRFSGREGVVWWRRLVPVRPLFGWRAWLGAWGVAGSLTYWLIQGTVWGAARLLPEQAPETLRRLLTAPNPPWLDRVTAAVAGLAVLAGAALLVRWVVSRVRRRWFSGSRGKPRWLARHLSEQIGIRRGLLHDYHLQRRLLEIFDDECAGEPEVRDDPLRLVVVAAPLQPLHDLSGQQVWAKSGTPLVTALRAALAVPGLFAPVCLETEEEIRQWVSAGSDRPLPPMLDLVDGAVVRMNPIPAFFAYLKRHRPWAQRLEGRGADDPRVHVVYPVPLEPATPKPRERIDIVDSVAISLELASRRDTELERRQANFISTLEKEVRHAHPDQVRNAVFSIFTDDIAPEHAIRFRNPLAPTRQEILTTVAAGCRRTLESRYGEELGALAEDGARSVACARLLSHIALRRSGYLSEETPGLPEVCQRCTQKLAVSKAHRPQPAPLRWGGSAPSKLARELHHLRGEKPRIVFVASGGVFRGASHIGVLGALRFAGIRPDLVVGASVGALLGGALGALSVLGDPEARGLLARLADTFLRVDERVALTHTLKNAAVQLGVRMRQIRLSPRGLGRILHGGVRSDPGFAATGAPPALIDAISELFLLPHQRTATIAAEFIAGHFAKAASAFFRAVKKETLRRLDIEHALMGTSLLAPLARTLLGEGYGIDLSRVQPYHWAPGSPGQPAPHPVSFFSTTTLLGTKESLLLGRDFLRPSPRYDFAEAGLASSAFPAVFSPRQEAQVLPGFGRPDVLLADGGMFDNLPFFAAIEVLSEVQRSYRHSNGLGSADFLARRWRQPDLFIAGALDAAPDAASDEPFSSLPAVFERATSLQKNVKIETFRQVSMRVSEQIGALLAGGPPKAFRNSRFIDSVVHASVLQVVPTDKDHINPTFAFSASTGLDPKRVAFSIADGCFQTFQTLAEAQKEEPESRSLAARSVAGLTAAGRIPEIRRLPARKKERDGTCPYFTVRGKPHPCPFAQAASEAGAETPELADVREVYLRCRRDRAHFPRR
jgi:predicted acylesterase/phospholipase RssA